MKISRGNYPGDLGKLRRWVPLEEYVRISSEPIP
jgi:hypothetical protein